MINRRFTAQAGSQTHFDGSALSARSMITGIAATTYNHLDPGSVYNLAPGIDERIREGALLRAIQERHDVRGLFNHNADNLLGRVSSGTCRLSIEPKGLRYEIDIDPNDPDHARVVQKIRRGDLTGSSFAFQPTQVAWEVLSDGTKVRWIEDLNLFDVGPVTFPAYQGTTTGLSEGSDELAAIRDEFEESKSGDCELQLRLRQLRLAQNEQAALELSYAK